MNRSKLQHARAISMVAVIAGVGLVLSGCGEGSTSNDDLYEPAREVNLTFKEAVGAVQAQIDDGEWDSSHYGDVPMDCDDGYGFNMTRITRADWRLAADAETTARGVGEWLGTNGWSDVQVKTYPGEIRNVIVQARHVDAHVARLDVDIHPGTVGDGVTIRATSTCQDGDPDDLMAVLTPGWPTDAVEHEPRPETEQLDATPIFGFTEGGQPR